MSDVDLLAMYGRATLEAFRLEAQQRYAVPAEDEQFRAFAEGRPIPSDPRVNRSMQVIRSAVAAGSRIRRVHVVDLPLNAVPAVRDGRLPGEHRRRRGSQHRRPRLAPGPGRADRGLRPVRRRQRARRPWCGCGTTTKVSSPASTTATTPRTWPSRSGTARLALAHAVPLAEFTEPG